jgi:adenylate cyclase class 2
MLEIEVKYRVGDRSALVAKLAALAAERVGERVDEDHYFNAPDRDFRQTDEAFRLRRIGAENRLTYKGPKRVAVTKTRKEIEIRLADGDDTATDTGQMLVDLGYRPVAVVRKRRVLYHLGRGPFSVEVCLDEVDHVGTFAEVEVVVDEAQFKEAETVVLGLAAELGLVERELRSYLGMVLDVAAAGRVEKSPGPASSPS